MLPPGNHVRTLTLSGRSRSYLLFLPPDLPLDAPVPVVLAFHGATSNGKLMEQFSALSDKAKQAGFVCVYPNGTGNTSSVLYWNGGDCCGYAHTHNIDDVGFVRALVDDLPSLVPMDPHRLFATGISNGAQMAYRLASEMADRIAAVAGVAGPMRHGEPTPVRPISILHIHGSDDEFAPFAGGVGAKSVHRTPFRSIPDTIAAWVRVNGCPEAPQRTEEIPKVHDGTRIVRHRYGPGRENTEVELIVVEGGGHTWPGRPPLPNTLGISTANLNANDCIWEFFQRHPMPVGER